MPPCVPGLGTVISRICQSGPETKRDSEREREKVGDKENNSEECVPEIQPRKAQDVQLTFYICENSQKLLFKKKLHN